MSPLSIRIISVLKNKSQTAPDLTPLPHVRDNVEKVILGSDYSLWTGLPILPGRRPRYGKRCAININTLQPDDQPTLPGIGSTHRLWTSPRFAVDLCEYLVPLQSHYCQLNFSQLLLRPRQSLKSRPPQLQRHYRTIEGRPQVYT